jgi:quinol monooxygenase YgiN
MLNKCWPIFILVITSFSYGNEATQNNIEENKMVRLVHIEVDPLLLNEYTAALREQMTTAVKLESGVLEYHVVSEKDKPYKFTLIEIYKDRNSYLSHIESEHFKKYKISTEKMVKSLELIDANLIAQAVK